MDAIVIEYQLTSLSFGLFLLAWFTDELLFSLVWYLLEALKILVVALQLLSFDPYGDVSYVDTFYSPFATPSTFLTVAAAFFIYSLIYLVWWHKPRRQIALRTLFYLGIYLIMCGFWIAAVPIFLYQILLSVMVGTLYAIGTAAAATWLLLPLIRSEWYQDTFWIILMGRKNTLLQAAAAPAQPPRQNVDPITLAI